MEQKKLASTYSAEARIIFSRIVTFPVALGIIYVLRLHQNERKYVYGLSGKNGPGDNIRGGLL
jgi:hypothetical protein